MKEPEISHILLISAKQGETETKKLFTCVLTFRHLPGYYSTNESILTEKGEMGIIPVVRREARASTRAGVPAQSGSQTVPRYDERNTALLAGTTGRASYTYRAAQR